MSFSTSSKIFREFYKTNTILFQIKLSGRRIKETLLKMHLVKIKFRFCLRSINQTNRIQVEIENMLQQISSISFTFESEGYI